MTQPNEQEQRTLAITLRPRKFAECVGQADVTAAIMTQVQSKRVPSAWLIAGESGGGKTTLARIMALSYQFPLDQFGNPPAEAWDRISEYCITEINASKIRGVDEIEKIAEESEYRPPPPSLKRVYILDEAHQISPTAQNLLLKFFEDTASSTVWIVCTTNQSKIIKTLRQRCTEIHVQPLDTEGLKRLVTRAAKRIGLTKKLEPLLNQLDAHGITSPRLVVKAVERYASGIASKDAIKSGDAEVDTLRICRAFVRGDWECIAGELRKSSPDDARTIRLGVLGYLRSILLSDRGGSIPPSRAAATILKLSDPGPIEDPAYLAWVSAVLCTECRKYGGSR